MSRSLPTGRTGRMAALGLTSVVIAIIWLGIWMPLTEWHAERAEALSQRAALAVRMATLVAAIPALQEQAAALSASGAGEPALLEGESDSMASASLQESLQAMFMQAGVQLNTVETLPGEESGAYRRIRLRISFNVNWPGLMTLLKDMAVMTPVLLVDELQIQPALHRIGTASGSFDVQCSVFAFRPGMTRTAVR